MIMKRQIGEKGQIVIPKDIREMFKLHKGESVTIEVKDSTIVIKKEQDAKEWLKNFLRYRKKGKSMTLQELKKIEEESYDLP